MKAFTQPVVKPTPNTFAAFRGSPPLVVALAALVWLCLTVHAQSRPRIDRAMLQKQIAELTQRRQGLQAELEQEMRRIQNYLAYEDQVLCIKSIRSEFQPQNIPQAVARSAATLYQRSFDEPALQALVKEHQQATQGLIQQLAQRIEESFQWPIDRTMDEYRSAAKAEVQRIQSDYRAKISQPAELAGVLGRAAQVLGWTNGRAELAPDQNPFAKSTERVTQALAEEHQRNQAILVTERAPTRPGVETPPPINVTGHPPGLLTPPPSPPGQATVDFAQLLEAAANARQQGKLAEAAQLYDLAARADPNSAVALEGLAQCHAALGNVDPAIAAAEALYRVARTPDLRVAIADLYLSKHDFGAARRWIEVEIKDNPNSAVALCGLGSIEWMEGKQQQARQTFSRVAQIDPNQGRQRLQYGQTLAQTQPARAVMQLTAALLLDSSLGAAYYYLAECYARLNQREHAAAAFRSYLNYDSTSEWAQRARQRLAALEAGGLR